jgi:ribosomal protein L40E
MVEVQNVFFFFLRGTECGSKKLRVKLYKLTASTNPDSTGQQENTVPNWSFQHRQNISTEDNPVTPYPILAAPKHCQNLRPKKKHCQNY